MKRILVLLVLSASYIGLKAQLAYEDIHTPIKSNWSIRFDIGPQTIHSLAKDADNLFYKPLFGTALYYKEFYLQSSVYYNTVVSDFRDVSISFIDLALGYNYGFYENWNLDFFAGMSYYDSWSFGLDFENYNKRAGLIGLGINRDFKLNYRNSFILSIKAVYHDIEYSTYREYYDTGVFVYSLTLAYRGWFRKLKLFRKSIT